MYILHIEHPVHDFEGWKKAFDSDPVGRIQSGVRRYWISRPVDDPNHVSIDLEFASQSEAAGLLAAMRKVWARVEGQIIMNPRAEIAEVVETHQY
ncbi:MAG: hypothetical protein ACM30E_05425 [Nitrososphaerales archaeon]